MTRTIAIFGGSFNPPGLHHRRIAEALSERFDEVIVVPCGPRPDKQTTNDLAPVHRAALSDIAFRGLKNVRVELFDLEQATFTRTHELQARFQGMGELWHVVGTDLTDGGTKGQSLIHKHWKNGADLWRNYNFAVIARPGYDLELDDLPPHHQLIELGSEGSSTAIREQLFHRRPYHHLVGTEVGSYISRYGLFRGRIPNDATRFTVDAPRILIEADTRNTKAMEWASRLEKWRVDDDPNMIVVIGGDGTMLRAIRRHWRLRLPFFGINAGHLGFLHNEADAVFEHFPPREMILRNTPMIYAKTVRTDGSTGEALGFNDAWVERASGQTAWVEVKINEKLRIPRLICDGVLLSTPQGSTAYARAMGATPLLADTPAWLLVGSNVVSPTGWSSALVSREAHVDFRNLSPEKRPLRAYVDGIPQGEVATMSARISRIASAELAFLPEHDMAEKIAQIQFPKGRELF